CSFAPPYCRLDSIFLMLFIYSKSNLIYPLKFSYCNSFFPDRSTKNGFVCMNLQTVPDLPHELCQFKNCPRLFYLKNCAQLYRLKNCPRLCCPKNCPSRTVPDEPDQPD